MTRRILFALVILLGAVPAARATSPWAGAGVVGAPPGPFLTDAHGRRLQLHGVDLVAKCGGGAVATTAPGTPCLGPAQGSRLAYVLSPVARDPGRRFTAADAATLARLGFDAVRLGIVWEGLEPGPAGVGPNDPRYCSPHAAGAPYRSLRAADPYDARTLSAYLTRTDRIVALLARAGIRVILDMHQDVYGSAFANGASATPWNGEGAPPWATCTSAASFGAPSAWGLAYGDPAVEAAGHHFFANDVSGDLQGQLARVWQAVARHYRGDADVLGYELYNEPADRSVAVPAFDPELQCVYGGRAREPASCAASGVQALPDGLIGAVQAADHGHVVFVEPPISAGNGVPETIGIDEPLRFAGIAIAFHLYHPPSELLAQVAPELARTRTARGRPPAVMDEFGATRNATAAGATVSAAGALDLSWMYWSALEAHDPTGNPREYLLDERTRRPWSAKAAALAVPYPSATAGTPGAESFDHGTRSFRYRYSVRRPGRAPTEIVMPRYTYPRGYRVSVSGATVTSARDAPLLALAVTRRGAVNVTVRPR